MTYLGPVADVPAILASLGAEPAGIIEAADLDPSLFDRARRIHPGLPTLVRRCNAKRLACAAPPQGDRRKEPGSNPGRS
jgi:hypothetical protein